MPSEGETRTAVRELWALREYAKTNPEAVLQFVRETDLSPLSKREALKVLHRKGLSEEKDLASEA
jgi:3-methyladenine DNA glycosylase AlkD